MATAVKKEKPEEPTGEVVIKRAGDVITVPPDMGFDEAIIWLRRKRDEDEMVIEMTEQLEGGFVFDSANAFQLAVKEMFGMRAMDKWNNNSINVPINVKGDTTNVYLGALEVPNLDGKMTLGYGGPQTLMISFSIKHKEREKVTRLMTLTRQILQEQSIYKGKAFRLRWHEATRTRPAGFHDPEFIRTDQAIGQWLVNADTREVLQATVWTAIQKADDCRRYKIPLKRAALLEGPYGTGKTMFSGETAKIAVDAGWTFVYLVDTHRLAEAFAIAVRYQPAVLFAEDIDVLMENTDEVPMPVRNTLDGIESKNVEVIVVLTTNHLEKMPKSMLRPGRLDSIVSFAPPDATTAEALIRQYAGSLLSPAEDLREVGRLIAGQIPATIREVVERSKLRALDHSGESTLQITAGDLIFATEGMQHHMKLLNREVEEEPSAMEQFGTAMGEALVLGAFAASQDVKPIDITQYSSRHMPTIEKSATARKPNGGE